MERANDYSRRSSEGGSTKLFAQSKTIQARLARSGLTAEVLYPPPPQRSYRCSSYGDHLLVVSRLSPLKRVDLVVRALAEPAAAGVRIAIAGARSSRTGCTANPRDAAARVKGSVSLVPTSTKTS